MRWASHIGAVHQILAFHTTLRHQCLARRGQIFNFRVDIEFLWIWLKDVQCMQLSATYGLICGILANGVVHGNWYCGSPLTVLIWMSGYNVEWVDTMLNISMKLTRFTERICKHCASVPGDSHFKFGLLNFTQDAMCQITLFGSALWWRYVMRNARMCLV